MTVAMRNFSPPTRGCVVSAESTSDSMVLAMSVRLLMSLIEYCTIPSRTPLRMALRTALWICASLPISVKMRGDCCGSICQRNPTSTVIPICSLESAAISSTCSPISGNCSSRVE